MRYINAVLTTGHHLGKAVELVKSLDLAPYIFIPSGDDARVDYEYLRRVSDINELSEYMNDDIKVVQNIVKEDEDGKDVVFTTCLYVVAILRRKSKGA